MSFKRDKIDIWRENGAKFNSFEPCAIQFNGTNYEEVEEFVKAMSAEILDRRVQLFPDEFVIRVTRSSGECLLVGVGDWLVAFGFWSLEVHRVES